VEDVDPRNATFIFTNEDHTLGNSLKYVLAKQFDFSLFVSNILVFNFCRFSKAPLLRLSDTALPIRMNQRCTCEFRPPVPFEIILLFSCLISSSSSRPPAGPPARVVLDEGIKTLRQLIVHLKGEYTSALHSYAPNPHPVDIKPEAES
jgi:hypothetical protein